MKKNKLKLLISILISITLLSLFKFKNLYRFSDGFLTPTKVTIVNPKINFKDLNTRDFNITYYNSHSETTNENELNKLSKYIKSLTPEKYPNDKGKDLLHDKNIKYYLLFEYDTPIDYEYKPSLISCYLTSKNSMVIKIGRHSEKYYYKSKINKDFYNLVEKLHKDNKFQ